MRRGLCCGLCCVVLAAASSQDFTFIAESNCSTREQGSSKSRRWRRFSREAPEDIGEGSCQPLDFERLPSSATSRFREVTVRGNLSISRG